MDVELQVEEEQGPRTGVFAVSGSIILKDVLQIKHGNLPDGRYRPGEAGESTDEELIRQAMLTWVDAADMPDEVATHLM